MTPEELHKDVRRPPANGFKDLLNAINGEMGEIQIAMYNAIVERCGLGKE